ncbi:hypothetical protein SLEP1_g47613 [Rubroshorea leprosula]|uniref:Tr-type G domain-containing protein n=2 Tax=Rubroshorea leprosula TaxID=152421 RepID=A0AAV5LRW7_9ROSI|nr:hypothetical protein SLEP1_g47613 [Rubroshorea leprosula]
MWAKDGTVSQPVKVEPKVKDEEAPALEDAEVLDELKGNKKRHLNVVFIGHVGWFFYLLFNLKMLGSQQLEDRLFLGVQVSKNMREKRKTKVESWYVAYIMDSNAEERIKGHKSYVPNMISGAAQADIGVLVISAHKGEFETGYEKGGQTCEHVQLAKTMGLSKLFMVVNKMDDPTVNWSKERYDEIESKMVPFLSSSG